MASERESESLLEQQTALAKFGEFALTSYDLDANGIRVVTHAMPHLESVSSALRSSVSRSRIAALRPPQITAIGLHLFSRKPAAGFALASERVLPRSWSYSPDGHTLLVRAGVGWRPGVVGNATSLATDDTFDGEALRTQEPVISADVSAEGADKVAPFVRDHGVNAFVNVNILGTAVGPSYGILEVDSLERRDFTQGDINFLRTYANLLAFVVQRLKARGELQRRADENERLLKELQHRIKNNLQILTSLVNFQARRSADASTRDELSKVGQRINALSLVHEKLYHAGQVESIELGAYLTDIARPLLRLHESSGGGVRLANETEWVEVPPELAITLGLVTNEFVTNSLKYAFGDAGGTVGIGLDKLNDERVVLRLWDDGKGIPDSARRGSGMDLIEALSRPIAGELQWSTESGVRLTLVLGGIRHSKSRSGP